MPSLLIQSHQPRAPVVSWTLVDNVCCPTYCSDVLTSEDCNYPNATCGSCISPPAADCMSGTMYNETLSVNQNEDWHYSIRRPRALPLSNISFNIYVAINTFWTHERRRLWLRSLRPMYYRRRRRKLD